MSTSTENIQKIVEIRLDKENFEQGVAETSKTLEKFKADLNFDGSEKGLETLGQSMLKLPLEGITSGVGKLGEAFSMTGVAVRKLVEDFTSRTWNKFENLIKSFTITPLTTGWQKYADKTQSVQTIMAATAQEFENVDEQMKVVEHQLQRLTRFTDETSYKFTDMVSNIGKFTSNGASLEDSVTAMQGIATWASLSGRTANEASRAMYNLSQAMGVGALKALDWKSIELANMATQEFKQTAIDTAESMGVLKKVSNDVWQDLKGNEVTVKGFRDSLKEEWLSADVLISVLKRYGDFADQLLTSMEEMDDVTVKTVLDAIDAYKKGELVVGDFAKEVGLSGERAVEILDKLSDSTYDLGRKAFRAAFETKTFREAMEYVAEAVGSSWMRTWEIIFGNYNKAKALWSDLAEWLYEIFVMPNENRNDLLEEWADEDGLNGRAVLIEGLKDALESLRLILDNISTAWHSVFPPTTAEMLANITGKFASGMSKIKSALQFTKDGFDNFKKGIEDVKENAEEVTKPVTTATDAITEFAKTVIMGKYGNNPNRQNTLEGMGLSFGVIQNEVNRLLDCSYRYEVTQEDIAKTSAKLAEINGTVAESVEEVAESIKEVNYSDLTLGDKLNKTFKGFFSFLAILEDSWHGLSEGLIKPLIQAVLPWAINGLLTQTAKLGDWISDIYNKIKDFGGTITIFGASKDAILFWAGAISDWFKTIKESLTSRALESVNKLVANFRNMTTFLSGVKSSLFEGIANAFNGIKQALTGIKGTETSLSIIDALAKAINWLIEISSPLTHAIGQIITSFLDWFKSLDFSQIGSWFGTIKEYLRGVWDFVKTILSGIGEKINFGGIIEWITGKISNINVLDSVTKFFSRFTGIFDKFKLAIKNAGNIFDGFSLKFNKFGATTRGMLGTHGIFDPLLEYLGPIGEKLKGIFNTITEIIRNLNFDTLLGYLKSGTTIFALMNFGKMLGSMSTSILLMGKIFISASGILDSFGGIFTSFSGVISKVGEKVTDGLGSVFNGIDTMVKSTKKSNAVKQMFLISLAVVALAGAVWLLATQVPPERLWSSVGAVAALVAVLAGGAFLLGKSSSSGEKFDATLIAASIVGFAAAALILVGAMKLLEGVNDFWTGYWKLLAIIGALAVVVVAVAAINRKAKLLAGINTAASLLGIMFFAAAVKKVVESLILLTGSDLEALKERMPILIGIMFSVVFVAMLAKAIGGFGGAMTLTGVILSIWVFIKALKSLANEDWGMLYATMLKAIGLIGILMGFVGFLSMLNEAVPNGQHLEQTKIAGALVGFGIAMLALSGAMKIISGIDENAFNRSLFAVGVMAVLLTAFTYVARLGEGKRTAQLAVTFIGLSIALFAMVGCVWLLSKMAKDADKMWEGIKAIFVLMLAVSMFTFFTQFASKSTAALVALTVLVTMLALAVLAISFLPTNDALAAAIGLGIVFVAFGKILEHLGSISSKELAYATVLIFEMAALIAFIGGLIWWMNRNIEDPSRLIPIMQSVGGLLLAVSGAAWILQHVKGLAAVKGAFGMAGVIGVIAGIGAISAGLQWLAERFGGFDLFGAVEKGLDILVIIGGKLGETLAAFTVGATSKGEEVGNNLTKFVEAVTPFVEFLKSDAITPSAMRKLDPLKDFLNTLGELTIDPTLFQTLEGTDTTAVGKSFTELATGFQGYAEALSGITNWDVVDKASRMIEALGSITVPGYQPQWSTFLVGASEFATSLVNMVGILNGASFTKGDAMKIEWFAEAASALAKAGNSVKAVGSVGWSSFTSGLDGMTSDLKKVAANMAILTSDESRTAGISYLIDIVGDLVELNKAMVPQGGLKQVIWEGEKSWGSFSKGLVSFATTIKTFGSSAYGITQYQEEGIDKAKRVTDKLVTLQDSLPTVDSVIAGFFIGKAGTWTSFGEGLAEYGLALKTFGESCVEINDGDVDKAITLSERLVALSSSKDFNSTKLYTIGDSIAEFGTKLKSFYDNAVGYTSELYGIVHNIVVAFTGDISDIANENLTTLGETIALLTTGGIDGQSKLFAESGHGSADAFFSAMWDDVSLAKATNAGMMMMNYLRQTFNQSYDNLIGDGNMVADKFLYGISQKNNDAETAGRILQTIFRSGLNDYDQEFYDSGRQAAQGFINGLKDEDINIKAYEAGANLAQNVLDGAKDKMKEHSPSKAMFELGSYGAEGFVLGLQDWYSTASFVGSSLSEKALEGLRSTISLMSEAISSDLDTDPVITPVLDLSRVSAGARVLNGLVNSNPIVGSNRFAMNQTPQNEGENAVSSGMTFIQNNYSPKALSRTEIYRQTKNQFSAAKGLMDGI